MTITYRWLGVAGLEFTCAGYTLLIDPFFTRPGKAAILAGRRVHSNAALVAKHIDRADALLVTHPHYDHLLDVPEVLRRTGAPVYGSPNTCALLSLHGIPAAKMTCIRVGDRFDLGPFTVEVFPARHTKIPLALWLNGGLPWRLRRNLPHQPQNGHIPLPGMLPWIRWLPRLRWQPRMPLRLSDYRMDACYSFRLQAEDQVLLVGNYPVPADVLFISPYHPGSYLETVLLTARPRKIVPIHWDDFTRSLALPLLPMLLTPAQGLSPVFPPIRRMELDVFTRQAQQILPGVEVDVPVIFKRMEIG